MSLYILFGAIQPWAVFAERLTLVLAGFALGIAPISLKVAHKFIRRDETSGHGKPAFYRVRCTIPVTAERFICWGLRSGEQHRLQR